MVARNGGKYKLVNGFLTICDGVKNRDNIIEVFFPNYQDIFYNNLIL